MDFAKRSKLFQDEVTLLQKKYAIELYAAQAVIANGELITIIKMRDLMPPEKTYDQTQKGDFVNKEVQKGAAKS